MSKYRIHSNNNPGDIKIELISNGFVIVYQDIGSTVKVFCKEISSG